ncbi:hypothetical protein KKB18_05050 [bacterium]|nr:hypothetical protein [bacterium]
MRDIANYIAELFGFFKEINPLAGLFMAAWFCVLIYFIFTRIEDEEIRRAFLNVMLSLFLWGILLVFSSVLTFLLFPAVIVLLCVIFFIIWQHRKLMHGLSPRTITFYVCSYILLLVIMFWTLFILVGQNS